MHTSAWVRWAACAAAIAVCLFSFHTPARADGSHTADQPSPIQLGTSGGNVNDRSSAFCCSGTLGALVEDADGRYILSNNHVLAVTNKGTVGDAIIEPGLIDQSPVCAQDVRDTVATLTDYIPIKFSKGNAIQINTVDAAIAEALPGAVATDGSILDIGPVSLDTLPADAGIVNQAVQKSGRTTGRTTGVVAAIGVDVNVGYSKACGSGGRDVARFANQILVTPGSFSAGGDSGSLIVESGSVSPVDGLPRAVGLLFAGSSEYTLANPIDAVLGALGVSMVSGAPAAPLPTGTVAGTVTDAASGVPIGGATVSVGTGESATTAGDGTYTIANVPTGDQTVTASAVGYAAQSQGVTVPDGGTATANFALTEAVVATSARIECVAYDGSGGGDGKKHLAIAVSVFDDLGQPVAGAEVRIDLFRDGAFYGSGSGAITDTNGLATYRARNAPDGSYVTTVTDVITSLAWDGTTPENQFRKGVDSTPDNDCRGDAPQPSGAAGRASGAAHVGVDRALAAKERAKAQLFQIEDVVGVGVGLDGSEPEVQVYLARESAAARRQIPATLDGVATRVIVTGPFEAY